VVQGDSTRRALLNVAFALLPSAFPRRKRSACLRRLRGGCESAGAVVCA